MASKKTQKKPVVFTTTITLPNGQRKWIRGASKEVLEKKKNQLLLAAGQGIDIFDATTFGTFAETWFETYKKPYLRPSSLAAIRNILDNHTESLNNILLKDVSPMQIQMLLASLNGKSRTLNAQTLQVLRGVFAVAVDNGLLLKSPVASTIRVGGSKTKQKTALTKEQSQQLLDAVAGTRAYLFCLIALKTGMRRGEILGLQWSDIDLERKIIHVTHNAVFTKKGTQVDKTTKTAAAHRDLPIPPSLLTELQQTKEHAKGAYVIHGAAAQKPMTRNSFRKMMKLIETRTTDDPTLLGKPIDPTHPTVIYGLDFKVTAHQLRHTYLTSLFEAGLDVKQIQYLAGHASPSVTMSIYVHYQQESRQTETAQMVSAALG